MSDSTLDKNQLAVLMSPLHSSRVAKRGNNLSYVEAYDVKATLIRVFGFGGFSAQVSDVQIVDMREVPQSSGNKTNWKVSVRATVTLTIHKTGAVYSEAAVGGSAQPDITEALDMATKTAESDALKRCATYLGTQFGLSLYKKGSTAEIVQVMFEPEQSRLIEQARQERAAQISAEAQGQLQRALGAQQQQQIAATPDGHGNAHPQQADEM